MSTEAAVDAPTVALRGLDDLWFQITGTICNLTCSHCFISCSPTNHTFEIMPKEQIFQLLDESRNVGVKEYYFTGGEPFIHPHLVEIMERTLELGPATVLTNGTLFKEDVIRRLAEAEARSVYSLEIRVSIDGYSSETNDPIRGEGTFERAMSGVRMLLDAGFLPVITMAQTWEEGEDAEVFERFVCVLTDAGYERARIKIIPTLRIGAEVERNRGYFDYEKVTTEMLEDFDTSQLVCSHSRMATAKGIFVCPILIEAPEARMGETLAEADRAYPLGHHACYTCYVGGAICSNPSAGGGNVS